MLQYYLLQETLEDFFMQNDKDLTPIIIDLGARRKGQLNESFLVMMGGAIKMLLKRMFGGPRPPVKIRGTRSEIDSFSKALTSEKKYMDAALKYGLTDPRTYKNKSMLNKAISNFERTTGIKWAFRKP